MLELFLSGLTRHLHSTRRTFYLCLVLWCLLCIVLGTTMPLKAQPTAPITELKDRWISLIVETSSYDYVSRYIEGAKEQAEELGLRLELLDARNNQRVMPEMVHDVTLRGTDGILLSHGDPDLLRSSVSLAVSREIPVVAIHCDLHLQGVSQLSQDDRQIARLLMNELIDDTKGMADLFLIWVAGYKPMEERMSVYSAIMADHPGLRELERFGSVGQQTDLHTEITLSKLLDRYPAGMVDVVIATWDEFAKGAARAITLKGRNEIKLYGVDISDTVLSLLQSKQGPYIATVGVDSKTLGRVQVRMVASAILGNPLPESYSLKPVVIRKSMLPVERKVSMDDLPHLIEGWDEAVSAPFQLQAGTIE